MPHPGMVAWERSVWLTVCYASFLLGEREARCAFALKRAILTTTMSSIAFCNHHRDHLEESGSMPVDGEPSLTTEPRLLSILQQLVDREPIFHRPEFGTTRADFERMVTAEFWEVGASGRRYSREFVLDELAKRHSSPVVEQWETDEFHCLELAPHLYLLTYTLSMDERKTRRSTIWKRDAGEWKIVYHQGTVVAESAR